ncbi:Os06g0574425 [Oryza sativa Japonica Group]|uniref:Os06g0574425 protein n=1 Tax=Oryza sativa subsp. japonica TaxID=39947 RepID=A0A0P0WYE5_ORYSJ|nr:Os06g0574425 [Oryza sativa Japonica Group]
MDSAILQRKCPDYHEGNGLFGLIRSKSCQNEVFSVAKRITQGGNGFRRSDLGTYDSDACVDVAMAAGNKSIMETCETKAGQRHGHGCQTFIGYGRSAEDFTSRANASAASALAASAAGGGR